MNWLTCGAVVLLATAPVRASDCSEHLGRDNLARCVLAASPELAVQRQELEAAQARVTAASPLLPSNPTAYFYVSDRSNATIKGITNWNVALQQELEIAGQRGTRINAARADVEAATLRNVSSRLDVLTVAWSAFFAALAARDARLLTAELYEATATVARVARAKADEGLVPPVDADVAEATSLRVMQELRASERDDAAARALLAALVAAPEQVQVDGELTPLAAAEGVAGSVDALDAADRRPDVRAAGADEHAFELKARALERKRIPNPTLHLFIQNDGFNEAVHGVGLTVPLPVPGNVGHTQIGEIAEARALAERAANDRARRARDARLAIVTHVATYRSLQNEAAAFTPERMNRARNTLTVITDEVQAGRLAVRDAVLAQQTLVELLRGYVATRRELCMTSVQLIRAAGLALDEVGP